MINEPESATYPKVKQRIQSGEWNKVEAFILSKWGQTASQSIYAQLLLANLACKRGHFNLARNHLHQSAKLGALNNLDLQEDIRSLLERLGNTVQVNGKTITFEGVPTTTPWPEIPEFEVFILLNALNSFSKPIRVLEWGQPSSMNYLYPQLPLGSQWDLIFSQSQVISDTLSSTKLNTPPIHENTFFHTDLSTTGEQYDLVLIDGKDKKQCLPLAQQKCHTTGLILLRDAQTPELNGIKIEGMIKLKLFNKQNPSSTALHLFAYHPHGIQRFLELLKNSPLPYLAFDIDRPEDHSKSTKKNTPEPPSSPHSISTNNRNPLDEPTNNSIRNWLNRSTPLRLNIGCGTVYLPHWINIDNNSDQNISQLDLNWDLRNPLPFPDHSVDMIFNEHFLEHLSVEEGIRALQDFRRVLKVGGIMRIAMPDLEDVIKNYLDPQWRELPFLNQYGMNHIKTRAELINISFRSWGHQHLYDAEELHRRLSEVGFTQVKACRLRESQHIDLQSLESRNESTLIAEVVK